MAKIVGNVVGLPNPQPDWNQTNKTKADYIKNKPRIGYEADLQWGGENLSNKTSPIDVALLDVLSSNRFAFMPPEYVVIEEYGDSSDGTSVWKTRALAGHYKTSLTTDETRIAMSKTFTSGGNTYNVSKIRVTFTVPKGSMYMEIKKLMIKFGTGGRINTPCTVSVAKYSAPNEFRDVSTHTLNGDPGWNVIQFNGAPFGGFNNSPDTHITSIRLTFEQVGDGYNNISLQSIYAIAPDCWTSLNPMQKRGTPYVVQKDGATVFYANNKEGGTTYAPIQASEFRGVATRAIADENGNNIAASLANIESQIPIWNKKKSGVSFLPSEWKKEITMGTVTIKAEDKGFTYVAPYMSTAELNIEKASDVKYCLLELANLPSYVTVEVRRAFENAHMYIDFTYDSVNKKYQFYCGITSEEPPKIMIPTILTLIIQRS